MRYNVNKPVPQSGYSGAAMDFSSESEMLEGRYKPVDMNKHFDPSERLSEQYVPRALSHDEPPSYSTAANVRVRGHRRTSSIHEIPDSPTKEYERKEWGSKAEFLLSCLSYSVGIGSIWRFPFLAHQHGGGAFLIPYSILLILVGTPMYYMETAMGQFSRLSCLQVWRSTPLCTGVGVGMLVLSLIKVIHTTTLMAYSIVYFVSSIQGVGDEVPWAYCGSWWGSSENCISLNSSLTPDQTLARTDNKCIFSMETDCSKLKTSVEEYWLNYVLGIGRGLHEFGDVGNWRYHLPLSLLLAWIFIFICIIKGTVSSGKAVYVTGLLPYAALISLLARSLTLPGGFQGIQLFFKPDWEQLKNPMVWKIAAEEQFYSLGITYGVLFMLGSHNKFKNKVHIDSSILPTLHFSTYILTSCVAFALLGNYSVTTGIDTKHVLKEAKDFKFDPALAFIIYPQILSSLPLAWVWSAVFFSLIFLLGLNSGVHLVQSVVSAVYDGILVLSLHKAKVACLVCASCFLLGLPCVSANGVFIYSLMARYGVGIPVLWIALWEVVSIMWIYGYNNIAKDIALMVNYQPNWFWKICWAVLCPLVLLTIFITSILFWEIPVFNNQVEYPDWAHIIGWILIGISTSQVVIWAVLMMITYCCRRKLLSVVKPSRKWGPGDPKIVENILLEQRGKESAPDYRLGLDIPDYHADGGRRQAGVY